jgi:nucleotide-binding universal stress UspA family protein
MFTRIVVAGGGQDGYALAETLAREGAELYLAGGLAEGLALAEGTDAELLVTERPAGGVLPPGPLPCPVAVMPAGHGLPVRPPTVLGVGFDASPESTAALCLAMRMADALGARLRVRMVAEVLAPMAAGPTLFDDDLEHELRAKAVLDRALARLGIPVEGDVVCGAPGDALQAFSQDVDLLLTGAPGDPKRWRLIDESPAQRLLLHAGCPVLLVPRARTP